MPLLVAPPDAFRPVEDPNQFTSRAVRVTTSSNAGLNVAASLRCAGEFNHEGFIPFDSCGLAAHDAGNDVSGRTQGDVAPSEPIGQNRNCDFAGAMLESLGHQSPGQLAQDMAAEFLSASQAEEENLLLGRIGGSVDDFEFAFVPGEIGLIVREIARQKNIVSASRQCHARKLADEQHVGLDVIRCMQLRASSEYR